MNNLPETLIRYHILPYIDISDYFNVSQVCQSFRDYLLEMNDPNNLLEMLKEYRIRKVKWFSEKLKNIPSEYLSSLKAIDVYLLLQDVYHKTNYVQLFNIKIPDQDDVEFFLTGKHVHHTRWTRKHNNILKKMKEDIHLSIDSSIGKLNNNYNQKIKIVGNNK